MIVSDRVYDIGLQRGPLDASHGFRALDYWAREQKREDQDRTHYPVIIAEQIRGSRFWTLLETLAESIDLLALEVRSMLVDGKPVVWIEPVILPEDLYPTQEGEITVARTASTQDEWLQKTSDDFQRFFQGLMSRLDQWGLGYNVNWSAKSYIGLWKNSRCWCPIWPRKESGGRLYLPAPTEWGQGGDDAPPPGFVAAAAELAKVGLRAVWSWAYNMGANPVALTLSADDLDRPEVRRLIEASWRALP